MFREDSDGGIHILHKRHIASIEPVCTSTDVPSQFFLVVQKIPLLWLQLKCFNLWSLHNRGYTGAPSVITTLVLPPFVFEEMSEKALHSNKRLRLRKMMMMMMKMRMILLMMMLMMMMMMMMKMMMMIIMMMMMTMKMRMILLMMMLLMMMMKMMMMMMMMMIMMMTMKMRMILLMMMLLMMMMKMMMMMMIMMMTFMCRKNSNSVGSECAHIVRTLTSPEDDVLA